MGHTEVQDVRNDGGKYWEGQPDYHANKTCLNRVCGISNVNTSP